MLVFIAFMTLSLQAQKYKVSLYRIDRDLYQIDLGMMVLKTRFCFQYAYGEEAIFDDMRMEVTFGDRNKCDVEGIYTKNMPKVYGPMRKLM